MNKPPAAAFAVALAAACVHCGGNSSQPERPEATLAKSEAAQRSFRAIHARWLLSTRGERLQLEPQIVDYLARYSADDSVRVARVYLAWIRIEQGRLSEARAAVDAAAQGPSGSAHDAAVITQAAILTREGKADAALELLRPLRGRIVDPRERLLFGEEIVRAALAGRHHVEVMAYLLDWLAFAPAEDRYSVQTLIEARLERVPPATLERSLRELDLAAAAGSEASSLAPARDWLRKAVRARLTRVALESRDGALARRLLDTASVSERSGDQRVALERIAASSSIAPRVAGRAVGLLLTLRDSTTRRRSAHAAAGISRALGLPRANSNPQAVRLITGDDGESADTEQGLLALAGEGAAILVAGVDEASAGAAQRYAEAASIPVILLHAPKDPPRPGGFGFVLGTAVGQEDEILTTALSEQGLQAGIRIGPGGLSCEDRPQAAGEPRFGAARGLAADSLLLLGDAACARDAIAELGQRRARPVLAFGLECAELFQQVDVPQLQLSASTGSFPWRGKSAPDSMRRWKATSGAAPSWYEVLGRDAGQLAMTVLQSFPLDRVDDARAVTNLHDRAQDELAKVSVELWSSERRGFLGARTLERKIVVIESAGTEPRPKRAAAQARR